MKGGDQTGKEHRNMGRGNRTPESDFSNVSFLRSSLEPEVVPVCHLAGRPRALVCASKKEDLRIEEQGHTRAAFTEFFPPAETPPSLDLVNGWTRQRIRLI